MGGMGVLFVAVGTDAVGWPMGGDGEVADGGPDEDGADSDSSGPLSRDNGWSDSLLGGMTGLFFLFFCTLVCRELGLPEKVKFAQLY